MNKLKKTLHSTSIKMGGLLVLGLFFFSSCQKEETVNSNVEYVKKIFEQEGIKKYKIDIEKVSSSEFDRNKFKEFVELRSKNKNRNNLKTFDMLAILAIAFSNFDFSISDVANSGGGGGYSCSANLGSEHYGFYKGPGGATLHATNSNVTWTTTYYSYNASTNKHTFIGYDTYTYGIVSYDSDYEITVRRVGTTCYFTRGELW